MTGLLWYDKIDRVDTGRKRHIYTEANGGYLRICACRTSGGLYANEADLTRAEVPEVAGDTNACERCLNASGLDAFDDACNGAEVVRYDPFGVLTPDEADRDAMRDAAADADPPGGGSQFHADHRPADGSAAPLDLPGRDVDASADSAQEGAE